MSNKYVRLILGLCIGFIALMLFAWLLHSGDSGMSISSDQNQSYPYSSCYSHYQGKVYYNKPFRGYFEVKDADIKTFKPLTGNSDNGTEGEDKNHVYFKTKIVDGLSPAAIIYLGMNYCKDANRVFYGAGSIADADVKSFTRINGYYAADSHHVYYKQKVIETGDPATIKMIGSDKDKTDYLYYSDYLKDKNHVYYKGGIIKGALPGHFICLKMEDGPTQIQYAFDGRHYFFQGREILIDHDEEKSTDLKLLSTDIGFTWYAVFYKGNDLYVYDYENKELVQLGMRDNSTPFLQIDRGLFKDKKHIYFTFYSNRYSENETGMAVVESANTSDFKQIGSFTGQGAPDGVLYQSGTKKYFHITEPAGGTWAKSLGLFDADGTIEDLPVTRAFVKTFPNSAASEMSWKSVLSIFKRDTDYNDH